MSYTNATLIEMIFSAVGDFYYNLVLLAHILLAFVALSPMFVYPLIPGQMRPLIMPEQQRLLVTMIVNTRSLHGPALIGTGMLGFALSGLSGETHSIKEGWVILAAVIWVAMNGVLHAMIIPSLKSMGAGHLDKKTAEHVVKAASEHSTASATDQLVMSTIDKLNKSDTVRVITVAQKQLGTSDSESLHKSVEKSAAQPKVAAQPIALIGKHLKKPELKKPEATDVNEDMNQVVSPPVNKTSDKTTTQQLITTANEQLNKKQTEDILSSTAQHMFKASVNESVKLAAKHPGKSASEYLDTSVAEHISDEDTEHLAGSVIQGLRRGSTIMTFLVVAELWLMVWQPDIKL